MRQLRSKLPKQTKPVRKTSSDTRYADISANDLAMIEAVSAFTMTGIDRRYHLIEAVRYIARNKIPGDIVECGVWRGGSMMLIAKTLVEQSAKDRDLYLFDTFEGMPPPSSEDVHPSGFTAKEMLEKEIVRKDRSHIWAIADENDVRANMATTGYPSSRVHYISGLVENTLPMYAPERVALLRLDTDWYESTKHELVSMYPRVVSGGVIIIDDYGCWKGARKAVDEFVEECGDKLFLQRIDSDGRCIVKP